MTLGFQVLSFTFRDKALAGQAFAIRRDVFVREQGIAADLEYDHEEEARHYLLFLDGKPIATARWRETGKGIKLERFAVLAPFRNRGAGAFILKAILADVLPAGKCVFLHSQLTAVAFYERNGFRKVGEPFTEAGIVHFLMTF